MSCPHSKTLEQRLDPSTVAGDKKYYALDETDREEASEHDYGDRHARGLTIKRHHPELSEWGTVAANWAWDEFESQYLLVSGGLDDEALDHRNTEFLAYLWLRQNGKTDWHGMDEEVRAAVIELWGADLGCCGPRPLQ